MGRRSGQHARGPAVLIVVDTSVWIDHLRGSMSPQVQWLRSGAPDRTQIIVGDIVLLEVLQGMNSDARATAMAEWFASFQVVPMLDPAAAVRAAKNYRTLRALGITVRKTADMVIGTFCIDHALPLLHDDRDFGHMERHLGLQVVQP